MIEFSRNYSVHVANSVDTALQLLQNCTNMAAPTDVRAPSLNVSWIVAFIRHYGADQKLAITFVDDGSGHSLLAPFQMLDSESLTFICDEMTDYNDLLYSAPTIEAIYVACVHWLSLGIRRFILPCIPSDSTTINLFYKVAAKLDLKISSIVSDYIPIITTFPDIPLSLWPGVIPSKVNKLQQSLKSMSKHSSVTFRLIETEAELSSLLPLMMELHIDRWRQRGIASEFLDPRSQGFTYDICREALLTNNLFAALMFIDGLLASYHLCFRTDDTIFDWITSFSHSFRQKSPGHLLLLTILMNAGNFGFNKYSFMRGEEPYKYYWTSHRENTTTITLY